MTTKQELERLRRERDAAISRAESAETILRRVVSALDAIGAPKTRPCDPMINETGERTLRADERILALWMVTP